MKKVIPIIALMAISIVASATCYFNWQCTNCGKFEQTSSYSCNSQSSPGYSQCNGTDRFGYKAYAHSWVMTGYFER